MTGRIRQWPYSGQLGARTLCVRLRPRRRRSRSRWRPSQAYPPKKLIAGVTRTVASARRRWIRLLWSSGPC